MGNSSRAMAVELARFVSPEDACAYLADRNASLEYRLQLEVTPDDLEQMLSRGWRRFGAMYFRPRCVACTSCLSLRIPVRDFAPSKSQRRVVARTAAFTTVFGRPRLDDARVELYHKWHAERESSRNWKPNPLDHQRYANDFCHPHQCAHEVAWYDGDRLIGIDVVDVTPNALNSVFFFYDPDYASCSLGVASVLRDIEWARDHGRENVYLGYYVPGCCSMEYKAAFRPYELLSSRPSLNEQPLWERH